MERKLIRAARLSMACLVALTPTADAWTSRSQRQAKSVPTSVVFTGSSTWVVPTTFPRGNNSIECIGAGAGGTNGSASNGGNGGGGGAYSKIVNANLTPGSTVRYFAAPTAAIDTNGMSSYFCNSSTNCASENGTAVIVRAEGGHASSDGYVGGSVATAIGTHASGGGNASRHGDVGGGAGGGAGGPWGSGGVGGDYAAATFGNGGVGGGGGGGGRPGSANTATGRGGIGGSNNSGLGAGAAGVSAVGGAGTVGGGGGGGAVNFNGGNGGAGIDLNGVVGSGGGGGGAGAGTSKVGGNGGNYGGGGGGGGQNGSGGTGAAGVCVVKYGGDIGETGGTISFVQLKDTAYADSALSYTSGDFLRKPQAGNLIVCWLEYNNGGSSFTVTNVRDTANNIYTKIVGPFRNPSMISGIYWEEVWYAKNVSAGTGATFAVTADLSTSYMSDKGIACSEYKGADPVNPFVQAATNLGNSNTYSIGPINIPQTPALVIVGGGNGGGTQQNPIGYSLRSTMNGSLSSDTIITATGNYTGTWKLDSAVQWQGWMAIFRSR